MTSTALWVVAYILIFVTFCLSVYFLRHQNERDDTNEIISAINNLGEKMDSLLEEIRKDRDGRD